MHCYKIIIIIKIKLQKLNVRTRFDLDPKQERIQVHTAQTMNL